MQFLKGFTTAFSSSSKAAAAFNEACQTADRLRDAGAPQRAIQYYEEALRYQPSNFDIRVQLGNMAKDCRQFELAENSYLQAVEGFQDRLAGSKRAAETTEIKKKIADVYCQLGHLFKDQNDAPTALDYYAASLAYSDSDHVLHEKKHLESIATDVIQFGGPASSKAKLPGTTASPLASLARHGSANRSQLIELDSLFATPVQSVSVGKGSMQCICWSKEILIDTDAHALCAHCGTRYSPYAIYLNEHGLRAKSLLFPLSAETIGNILGSFGLQAPFGEVGIVNLDVAFLSEADRTHIRPILADSGGITDRGTPRLSFDVVVVPNLSVGISNIYGFLADCRKLLKPSGKLIVGYTEKGGAGRADPSRAEANLGGNPQHLFFEFSSEALLNALQIEATNSAYLGTKSLAGRPWIGMRKSATMSMGVMSGIGDASWSFMFAEAVMKKYQSNGIELHIHHSGDFRAKRSNNMLARFSFVKELASSRFDIHAHPPMNDATGHINYIPSGPVPLSSADEFDYRLVFNTFFEHGWSVEQVCARFDLNLADIRYDFFEAYAEKADDLKALQRLGKLTGDDYIIFHYGATNTNTEEGLNRGEIWKPEDWNRLGRLLHDQFGCRIVVIGAVYDLDYSRRVLAQTTDDFYVNTIGQTDITETLALIRRARMIVSFPSGVGIVGPYLNVPTCIFWRPKDNPYHPLHPRSGFEREFAFNWVPPARLADGSYYHAWYGTDTPDSIFRHILDHKWWDHPKKG